MPEPDPPKEPVPPRKRAFPISFVLQLFLQVLISAILFGVVVRSLGPLTKVWVTLRGWNKL